MTWLLIFVIAGSVATAALWATFVYIAVRETKAEMPGRAFASALDAPLADQPGPMKVLLPIDGSEVSAAAVQEVAHCPLPPGSVIELLYVIHSRLPVIPDFPPWAVTISAAHGESIRAQTQHAPEVLTAAGARAESFLGLTDAAVRSGLRSGQRRPQSQRKRRAPSRLHGGNGP